MLLPELEECISVSQTTVTSVAVLPDWVAPFDKQPITCPASLLALTVVLETVQFVSVALSPFCMPAAKCPTIAPALSPLSSEFA